MAEDRTRHRLVVSGVVQGVGFRPFVYALASKLGLSGSVGNNSSGVTIEVEGPAAVLTEFRQRLPTDAPSLARIDAVSVETVPVVGGTGFEINLWGLVGFKAGWVEGFEVNLLGLVAGFDIRHPAVKLPGYGRLGFD